ncbi:helix-turn-helix transcriptional regulator [Spirosoma aureum]|uniref:Helix-turn-helix transcriptional regulator n=1 Tax=Spirosoma aureum TaxID=2692134 RepID=A0A6G9AN78_9BACT|nr:AraC family transcriptional regulator [Spirosoma aureum]QIP13952.1 helix-turn-helix transcriptional regulator [Spirosoma aureum]
MEITIKSKGVDTPLRQEELTGNDGQTELFKEKHVRIQHEQIGCITDTQLTTGNFFMAHCKIQLTQSIQLVKEVEGDIIQLDFALRGESKALTGGKTMSQAFSTGQHNIAYIPPSESIYDYYASPEQLDYSVVVIPKENYFRLIPPDSDLHQHLVTRINQKKAAYVSAKNLPITSAMDWIIRDMRASQRTGSLKRLFLESRITELLMLQLEQMQSTQPIGLLSKKADIHKIHEAREVLDSCYPNTPTIIELAKLVGLNEFNLKRGFKEQLGTTILGYITQRRMEDARRFLLEGEKTISEIAYWVGYKNPAHFTVAFKKYFGMLPSAIRTHPGCDLS